MVSSSAETSGMPAVDVNATPDVLRSTDVGPIATSRIPLGVFKSTVVFEDRTACRSKVRGGDFHRGR